jgi:ferredoxin
MTGTRLEEIDILGEMLESLQKTGFNMPITRAEGSSGAFALLGRVAKSWLIASPRSNNDCIGCSICAQNCPVDAITITDQKRAVMDLNICIRCYCCHEMCPENAIDLHRPWIGRMLA